MFVTLQFMIKPVVMFFVLRPVHIPNMTGLQVDRDCSIPDIFVQLLCCFFPSVPTSWHILAPVKARKQIIVFFYFLNPIWTWICSCLWFPFFDLVWGSSIPYSIPFRIIPCMKSSLLAIMNERFGLFGRISTFYVSTSMIIFTSGFVQR